LAGAFGLPLSAEEAGVFARLTQRGAPGAACRELLVLAGRRGGKSSVAAAAALYLAALRPWRLAAGEVGTVMVLACDRDQARVAFRYCLGLLTSSPLLAHEIESTTADTIRLCNGVEIVIGTSDKAAVRGRTVVAAILDELAFWGAEADEVLRALRPGMASQPEAMLIQITTAYSQRGPAFDTFRRSFGTDDPRALVVRATTRDLNPTISQAFIDEELSRDPQAARAEYLSEFRGDLEALFDVALLDAVTRVEPRELPHLVTTRDGAVACYTAAVDVSGGRQDATAAAVAHVDERGRVVVDAVRRWASPHDPVEVAGEVAGFLAGYRLSVAVADQYGAELSRSIYAEAGVALLAAEASRSEAYLAALPLFTSGRIEIPDDAVLRRELLGLERRAGRSGRDAVDHRPGQHDDVANALALAAWSACRQPRAGVATVALYRSAIWAETLRELGPLPGREHSLDLGRFDV
ncbi:MAG: hypothetical protein IT530_08755, partial [Burkholderiales bacterium]|nr:hypothetical protein [Burkholderiales bacterium]